MLIQCSVWYQKICHNSRFKIWLNNSVSDWTFFETFSNIPPKKTLSVKRKLWCCVCLVYIWYVHVPRSVLVCLVHARTSIALAIALIWRVHVPNRLIDQRSTSKPPRLGFWPLLSTPKNKLEKTYKTQIKGSRSITQSKSLIRHNTVFILTW